MSVGAVNKQTGDRIPTAGMPAIDNALSLSSTNPVQNAIITAALAGKQATLTFDDVPTENSNNPVKSGGVKSAIDAAVASAYHHAGTKTCAELVAGLLVAANEGNVYNITDSGTTTADFIEGAGQPIKAGDNVGIAKISAGVYKFDLLSGFVDTTNFVQKSQTVGLLKNDGTVDTDIEGDVDSLKSGLTNLDTEVNGDAVTYPYADVITIENAIPANVADCSVKIEPVQDLHGQSAPYVGGAGKNKLPLVLADIKAANTSGTWTGNVYTINNGTITVNTDDGGNITSIKVNGTFNADSYIVIGTIYLDSSTYILNGCPSGGGWSTYLQYIGGVGGSDYRDIGNGVSFNGDSDSHMVTIKVSAGTVSNIEFLPMIRLSTETDATFAPYTNLCPITGHTEASVQRDGKNLFDASTCTLNKYIDDDGTIGNASGFMYSAPIKVKTGHYKFAGYYSGSGSFTVRILGYDKSGNFVTKLAGQGGNTSSRDINIDIDVPSDVKYVRISLAQATDNAQLELGSTATSYEPYAGNTYTIALGDTIYGGTVDFDSGVMTVTHKYVDLGDFTYQTSSVFKQVYISDVKRPASNNVPIDAICEQYHIVARSLADNDGDACVDIDGYLKVRTTETPDGGFCYELATPITIQLTPTQIQLLKGQNTIYASTGDISVTVNGVSGSIGSVQEQVNELAGDVALKQNATDNNLTTTDKTIVGGINEVKSGLVNLVTNKVNLVGLGDITGNSFPDTMETAFNNLTVYDNTVAGRYTYYGAVSFIALKYTGGSFGYLMAIRFDGTARIMFVNNGVITHKIIALNNPS